MTAAETKVSIGGRDFIISTGKVAKQSEGSVTVRYGDTVILCTSNSGPSRSSDFSFFPLTVEYRERTYSAGKIPGGFFKREGKPRDSEILSARIIDRSIRPLFPWNLMNEVQVMVFSLSFDLENEPDVMAINGVSASLMCTGIPFGGPVGAVRVGKIDGKLVVNPTITELKSSSLDLVAVFSTAGVIMIEAGVKELPEAEVLEAIKFAEAPAREIMKAQMELASKVTKVNREYIIYKWDETLEKDVRVACAAKFASLDSISDKATRSDAVAKIKSAIIAELEPKYPGKKGDIKIVMDLFESEKVRKEILEGQKRPDGRKLDEIRNITCEVGFLPRTHGSAIFTRGQTQALVVATLGTKDDMQIIDDLEGEYSKRYMLHYNFPPFATGETKPARGPGRREIGHGALAEKALAPVIPDAEHFPYTIQLVSDILESNGSSSMASVCGGTLALMDAGVPISSPVAGISIGLVQEKGKFTTITDIAGLEDHYGDMDFKVAGTSKGVTAIQLDIKVDGISLEVVERAVSQSKTARTHILSLMNQTIPTPREKLSDYAPRIISFRINPEKIKDVIGPSGKIIKQIIADFGVEINIDNDGTVNIASVDNSAIEKAVQRVRDLTQSAEVGKIYHGKVRKIAEFGAFVEIFPGTDGLVHISELSETRVKRVEDVLKEGEELDVKCIGVDEKTGKIRLSRKELLKDQGDAK